MRRSRKGSLELSVNAIVILVMAIAILGLGLAFIRGALTRGQAQVFKAIDNAELENPATADKPVTVDKNVQVKKGESAQIKLGFYNAGSGDVTTSPSIDGCLKAGETTATSGFTLSSGSQSIGPGKAAGFQALLSVNPEVVAGSYVCTAKFDTYGSAQFFVTVAS